MKNLIVIIASTQDPRLIVGIGVILISILLAYVSLREYKMTSVRDKGKGLEIW